MRRALALDVASRVALCAAVCALPACDTSATSNELAIQLVTASTLNPAEDHGRSGTLTVRVEQDGSPATTVSPEFSGGTFDVPYEIESYGLLTRIAVEFAFEDGTTYLGAVPWFLPAALGARNVIRIPVGEPGTCGALSEPSLQDAHLDPAVLPWDSAQHWIIGGARDESSGHRRIGVYVPLWLTIENTFGEEDRNGDQFYPDLDAEVREAHSVELTDLRALVVGDVEGEGAAFLLERTDDTVGVAQTALDTVHFGAGAGSTVVETRGGAAIVGGGTETDRVASISWVADNGTVTRTTSLYEPRHRPAVVWLTGSDHLLVAGGQEEGGFLLEIVPFGGDGDPISAHTTMRERPIAVRPPVSLTAARGSALVIGGTDATGEPIATTLRITGCPGTACSVTEGPLWEAPRIAPAIVETESATLILGGSTPTFEASDAWDRVAFVADTLSFEQGNHLDIPRARATAVEIGHGIVLLVGGERSPSEPLLTFEMCWPHTLEGIDFP